MTEYYEDLTVDERRRYGGYTLDATEIARYGRVYDPQPYHVSETIAKESQHGGLIASGFHLLSIAKRLTVRGRWGNVATIAGLGIDDIRIERPVRPGETVFVDDTIVSKRRSESDPTRGIVQREERLVGDDDRLRMTWSMAGLVQCRTAEDE